MLKIAPVILCFLLSFSHYITCDWRLDYLQQFMTYYSKNSGSCSEYFQYLRTDDFINGKVTLPHLEIGDTVKMTFYRQTSYFTTFPGIFLPDGSSQEVISRLQKKQPISYRVDFPIWYDVPKLHKIFINDNEICETRFSNDTTGEMLMLRHTLSVINDSLAVFTYNIHIPHFAEIPTCGVVDVEIANRGVIPLAYGGKVINRGEFPWLTAIYKRHLTGLSFACAGSLVTSKIILSAAHCFQSLSLTAENIIAMLGRYNLTNFVEEGYTMREVEAVILHPDYQSRSVFSDADLALIEMKDHVSFTKYIKPICLWSEPADELRIVNQTGVVVGWGSDENGNSISIAPREVKLKIVSGEECLRSSHAFNAITSSRTLCAGNRDGSGPCEGDSGGGLMLHRNGVWMLRGVISLALKFQQRCDLQQFTVYCDVAKHMTWLQNYTKHGDSPVIGSFKDICGKSGTESRIEHPWLAAIYRKYPTGEFFYCTGSIISLQSVLVPANCFVSGDLELLPPYEFRVYLGRYDLNNINENGVMLRHVAAILFHPEYKLSKLKIEDNNIALLQLKDPVIFTQHIKPICLWSESMDQSQIVGQFATLSGWIRSIVRKEISTVPTSTEVNISSIEECQLRGFNVNTSANMLCITRPEHNFENFLMMKRNGRWLLRGVNSLRRFYESSNFCFYADIAEYVSWIQSNMIS